MEQDLSLRYDNGSGEQAPDGLGSVHQRPQPHGFLVQLDSSNAPIGARIHTFDPPKDPFDQPRLPGAAASRCTGDAGSPVPGRCDFAR